MKLLAGADAERLERDEQGVSAVCDADAVVHTAVAGERLLELLHERAADECRLRDDRFDSGVDLRLDRVVLGLQVD